MNVPSGWLIKEGIPFGLIWSVLIATVGNKFLRCINWNRQWLFYIFVIIRKSHLMLMINTHLFQYWTHTPEQYVWNSLYVNHSAPEFFSSQRCDLNYVFLIVLGNNGGLWHREISLIQYVWIFSLWNSLLSVYIFDWLTRVKTVRNQ